MSANSMKAPATLHATHHDERNATDAARGRETRPDDSNATPRVVDPCAGAGGISVLETKVNRCEHYTAWNRLRDQQLARDYWQQAYGRDAELASRGGVAWL